MPNTKSAKKRLRQNEKRRLANRGKKSTVKTQIKKVLKAAQGEDRDAMQNELKLAVSRLDKAAAKNLIHPNNVARKKSQLARLINSAANKEEA